MLMFDIGSGYSARLATPFAVLGIRTAGKILTGIEYLPRGAATLAPIGRFAERVCRQLEHYLDDPGFRFDLPFDYRGTDFQCRVWRAIHAIPSGRTLRYADIARRLRTAPRPVGGACGANRIPIVIPCHRVVGSDGMGGFMHARAGFPLEIKGWLLRHEGAEPHLCLSVVSSLLKNSSSHRHKPVSRKGVSSESTPYWMPAFAGMTK